MIYMMILIKKKLFSIENSFIQENLSVGCKAIFVSNLKSFVNVFFQRHKDLLN